MIYLDNSATTRTLDTAAEVSYKYMTEMFFNPAGAYSPAVETERTVNHARENIAASIKASANEVIFTSGGTESNNMAIKGSLKAMHGSGRLIMSAVEHPSVYEVMRDLSSSYDVIEACVDSEGGVDIEQLMGILNANTKIVSIMQVNNETGAINDIPAIYKTVKKIAPNALLHVDGVQGYMKVPFDSHYCDFYSVSGHKIHAPKGVGVLYVKHGTKFAGGQIGGGQEGNLRSGTTNTPGIMGLNAAVEYYTENRNTMIDNMRICKRRLAQNILRINDVVINGPDVEKGAPHILNASFMGVRGEVLLHALEEKGIYVSTGSACSAHKKGKNRILNAMGVTGERQESAIRFSLCAFNTPEEMDQAADAIADITTMLRRFKRR